MDVKDLDHISFNNAKEMEERLIRKKLMCDLDLDTNPALQGYRQYLADLKADKEKPKGEQNKLAMFGRKATHKEDTKTKDNSPRDSPELTSFEKPKYMSQREQME